MTDLHTHILPQMDDGSKSVEMSLDMLRMEREQGVDTVVLTPHFYRRNEEPERFLSRRQHSFEKLTQAIQESGEALPRLLLGAEVAWVPNMSRMEDLDALCIQGTRNMLLELPFHTWNRQMIDEIYSLLSMCGITPIFAHLERYLNENPEYIQEIISMGTPIQVSCEPLRHLFQRKGEVRLLKNRQAHLLATDCHNLTTRQPNMAMGLSMARKLLGDSHTNALIECADDLVRQTVSIA